MWVQFIIVFTQKYVSQFVVCVTLALGIWETEKKTSFVILSYFTSFLLCTWIHVTTSTIKICATERINHTYRWLYSQDNIRKNHVWKGIQIQMDRPEKQSTTQHNNKRKPDCVSAKEFVQGSKQNRNPPGSERYGVNFSCWGSGFPWMGL